MKLSKLLITIEKIAPVSASGRKVLRNTDSKKLTCIDKTPPKLIKLFVKVLRKLLANTVDSVKENFQIMLKLLCFTFR